MFHYRIDKKPDVPLFEAADFEGLVAKPFSVPRTKKLLLRGFIYSYGPISYEKMIVLSSGMGPGHLQYTSLIYALAKQGYLVVGFDNRGCNLSDGKAIGLPYEATIDLLLVLKYLKNQPEYQLTTFYGLGHSLGGYAVLTSLINSHHYFHKVVAISGFDKLSKVASKSPIMRGLIDLAAFCGYGPRAYHSASHGIKVSQVPTLFIYGDKDQNILPVMMPLTPRKNLTIYQRDGFYHSPYLTAKGQDEINRFFQGTVPFNPPIDFRLASEIDPDIVLMIDSFFNAS
jgi:pimeloyl-ACP methyl ester carboxylesterase